MPDFDSSPERLTSTSAGIVSRLPADSLESEWQSSQSSFTVAALRLCRWPMKCQRKASPCSACFTARSCARFSPTSSIPASASTPRSSGATYLVAATIVTSAPSSARIRSWFARTVSADKAKHALPAGDPVVAAVREEPLRRARRAEVDPVDARAAGGAKGAFGGAPEVELAVAHEPEAERATKRRRHLLAHLVAAGADPGPDDGAHEAAAECLHAGRGDAAEQPAPTRVQDGERGLAAVCPRKRDRQAVGGEREQRQAGLVRPEPVAALATGARSRSQDVGRMVLVVHRERVGLRANLRAEPAAILVHPLRLVGGRAAQVERRERALADATFARREDDLVRAGRVLPANHECSSR